MKKQKPSSKPVIQQTNAIPARTLHSLLSLAAENRSLKIPSAIARAVANTMQAEVCYLISVPDPKGSITVFEGFNLYTEEILNGLLFPAAEKPALSHKITSSQPYWNNDLEDVTVFFSSKKEILKGTVCMCPLITAQREPIGGILLLSPYKQRIWNTQDLVQLTSMVDAIARILQRVDYMASLEEKLAQATAVKPSSVMIGQELTKEGSSVDQNRFTRSTEDMTGSVIGNNNAEIASFGLPVMSSSIVAPAIGGPYAIVNDISETDAIRSAISAISGYMQLLKSESAGPLTPMQKKFLDRVQVSAGKITHAVTTIETKVPTAKDIGRNQKTALKPIIKEVLFEFSTLIDQKMIKVELIVPPDVPAISTNSENITRVLRTVLSSILFEAPSNGKLIIALKSVDQVKSRGGVLCSMRSILQGPDTKSGYVPGESDYKLENEVSALLTAVNGQVWVNQSIQQEKTVHLFFADHSSR